MSSELEYGRQVILIELDALLDTRLGVAALLDKEAWLDIAKHPGYPKRTNDDLSLFTDRFTKDEFFEAWEKRDVSAIEHSLMTNTARFIGDLSIELTRKLANENDIAVQSIEFVINLHPYDLSDEAKAMLVACLRGLVMEGCGVRTVRLPPSTLSHSYLRANFSSYMVYDLAGWLAKCEDGNYSGVGAPQIRVMAPRLFTKDGAPDKKAIEEVFSGEKIPEPEHLFEFMEWFHSPFISLEFLDPALFSIIEKTA